MVVTRSRKRNYSESSDDDSSMRPNVVRGRSLAPPARSRAARAQTRLAAVIQGVPTSGAPQASLTTQGRFAQARPQPSVPEVAAQVRSVETNESDEVIFISERQADPEIQLRMAQQARSQVTQSWNQLMVGVQTLEHPGSRSRMAEVLQQIQAQNSRTNIHQYQENVRHPFPAAELPLPVPASSTSVTLMSSSFDSTSSESSTTTDTSTLLSSALSSDFDIPTVSSGPAAPSGHSTNSEISATTASMPSAIFGISGSSENIGGLAPRAFSDIPTALLSTDNPSRFSAFSVYATLVAQASSQPTVNSRPPAATASGSATFGIYETFASVAHSDPIRLLNGNPSSSLDLSADAQPSTASGSGSSGIHGPSANAASTSAPMTSPVIPAGSGPTVNPSRPTAYVSQASSQATATSRPSTVSAIDSTASGIYGLSANALTPRISSVIPAASDSTINLSQASSQPIAPSRSSTASASGSTASVIHGSSMTAVPSVLRTSGPKRTARMSPGRSMRQSHHEAKQKRLELEKRQRSREAAEARQMEEKQREKERQRLEQNLAKQQRLRRQNNDCILQRHLEQQEKILEVERCEREQQQREEAEIAELEKKLKEATKAERRNSSEASTRFVRWEEQQRRNEEAQRAAFERRLEEEREEKKLAFWTRENQERDRLKQASTAASDELNKKSEEVQKRLESDLKRFTDSEAIDRLASEVQCPICQHTMHKAITTSRCRHNFCLGCLLISVKQPREAPNARPTCPVCREELSTAVTNRTLRAQAATIHNVRPGSCQTADYVEILDAAEKQAQDDDIIVGQVIMLV